MALALDELETAASRSQFRATRELWNEMDQHLEHVVPSGTKWRKLGTHTDGDAAKVSSMACGGEICSEGEGRSPELLDSRDGA